MKIGEVIEAAMWITGDESQEIRCRYEQDVRQAIDDLCKEHGFAHGPVTFTEKRPGDDRVPPVPDHIQGQRVRLLVSEAEIVDRLVATSKGSFIANLEKKDLQRLRTMTRRAWAMIHPEDILTNKQCDDYIDEIGPEAALDSLRKNVGVSVH